MPSQQCSLCTVFIILTFCRGGLRAYGGIEPGCIFRSKELDIMNILVIDAQGGGIGRQIVSAVRRSFPQLHITAVGTNSAATSAMLKAGADDAATGENAVAVCCRAADVIIGPVGIVIADALLGEITPKMAVAIGQSRAKRILIPVNHCDNLIAGIGDLSMSGLIESVIETLRGLL